MNNKASTSKQDVAALEENEIFEDSSILANFNNSSFRDATSRFSDSKVNDSLNSALNVSALCCDEEISGYDKLTGRTWIYPTNYPVRDYQFNIINAAMVKNTLVSLPTGLGKTFIAAVIMYNFYRWYPLGKIVFTAPTRPLVAQQIEACYDIVAIPSSDTVEMTGHMQANTRKAHWNSKRVFFATPQVIYNDIKSGICPADKIRCLVIDEAHRARGNYAYCQIVATLTDMGHKTYRVLALSATPGSKVEDVVNVIKNLHIAHLELRTENCIDVSPYSHARKINTVIVQLGAELTQLRQQYVEIMDGYARRLKQLNILPHNLGNLSKGRIVMLYKEYQTKDRGSRHPQHNYIMKDFMALIALYHGLELLVKHGSRVFLNFFDEHPEKTWIQQDDKLTSLLERLRDDLGINPLALDRSILPDGTVPEIPKNLVFGHPKFYKLKEIMLEHFSRAKRMGQDTRAIVFCEYRESVNLVHCLLLQCRPLITPQMFVGQGASGKDGKTVISQKQQLRVMRNFREGACNTLVATCVAEEGLDVGSVDLILCFDISTSSPIRLVQRCGRTGRERGGQVFILVTEGREHQTLLDCMRQRDGLNRKIQQSREVQASMYKLNPRMMPHDFTPTCQKMYITVAKKDDRKDTLDKAKKGQKDLRTMLLGRASSSGSSSSNNRDTETTCLISEQEFNEIFPEGFRDAISFQKPMEYWTMNIEKINSISIAEEQNTLKLSTWLEWQRTLQSTVNIDHSKDTEILAALLQSGDAKRFDMPASTQNPTFNAQGLATQHAIMLSPAITSSPAKLSTPTKLSSPAKAKQPKKKQKHPLLKSPGKKDGDIRALFSTATKSTKNYTKLINDLGIQNDGSIPTRLINLLVDLNVDSTNTNKTCYICDNVCDCKFIQKLRKNKKKPALLMYVSEPNLPDVDLIDDFDADLILKCSKNYGEHLNLSNQVVDDDISHLDVDNKNNSKNNFDLEFDFNSPINLTSPDNETKENLDDDLDKNFNIGDIEDIFADSSPEEAITKEVEFKDKNSSDPKETLGFFGLDSIDDIFADSDDSVDKTPKTPEKKILTVENKPPNIDKTPKTPEKSVSSDNHNAQTNTVEPIPVFRTSPSILSGKPAHTTSPIICSQVRKFKLSTKKYQPHTSTPTSNVRRKLIPEPINNNTILANDKENPKSCLLQTSIADTSNKSMFTITQLVDMINKTDHEKSIKSSVFKKEPPVKEDERSNSPILLTQAERMKVLNSSTDYNMSKITTSQNKKSVSLIILESDSDSDDTQVYELNEEINEIKAKKINDTEIKDEGNSFVQSNEEPFKSPINTKRGLELEEKDEITASPFFSKRPKLDDGNKKQLSLQEKVLAALTSNKINTIFNNDAQINFVVSPQNIMSQKENHNPKVLDKLDNNIENENEYVRKNNLEMLQMFRRGSTVESPKHKFNSLFSQRTENSQKRKLAFSDSDDDFMDGDKSNIRNQGPAKSDKKSITNHKVRKKKHKANSFLDLEAEISDDQDSGDELTDDSAGSIAEFICDDNVTHHDDMQAHYLRSIKSPVKGVFKIPELPKKHNLDVFSQFVEEDNYEMDSFCVDSHIGMTQANDMSELEIAEMLLEERKRKKKSKSRTNTLNIQEQNNDMSPLIRRKNKNVKRLIHSDSDDSS